MTKRSRTPINMPLNLNFHYLGQQPVSKAAVFYLHSANVFVLKAKRQLQKTPASIGGEMNVFTDQRVFKRPLIGGGMKFDSSLIKPPA